MKNTSRPNRSISFIVSLMLTLALVVSVFGLAFAATPQVSAQTDDLVDNTKIDIPNGQFETSDEKATLLASVNEWTGEYVTIGDTETTYGGKAVSGVLNLNEENAVSDDFTDITKLKERPSSPFGRNTTDPEGMWYYPDTDANALFINNIDNTAYRYYCTDFELAANSFYKFSVWVKTDAFASGSGAVFKISGFDYDIGIWDIDNSHIDQSGDNNFGFSEYIIYVATSQNTASVKLNLQVGDHYIYGNEGEPDYINHTHATKGWALFDNLTAEKLSANAFYIDTYKLESDNIAVYDLNTSAAAKSEILTVNGNDIGSFKNGLDGWTTTFRDDIGGADYVGTYNAGVKFNNKNLYGLSSDPYTPRGNSMEIMDMGYDRDILVMSIEKNASNVGVVSDEFIIERNKFYRLSVWANTQKFDDNSNASLVITGENNIPSNNYELAPSTISSIAGSGDINARYGWVRYFFYIRGSVEKDCAIQLGLWLGYDSDCTGTVMFDEIRLEELTYSYYNVNSSGGTVVGFDTEPTTTLDNGRFYFAENYGDSYPLKPVSWTQFGDSSSSVSGAILTNSTHYNENKAAYLNAQFPTNEALYNSYNYPGALLLASDKDSYFGYSSADITIAVGICYKITVTMATSGMTGSGANLWLVVNDNVITSLKNIGNHESFTTYTFYVQGGAQYEDELGVDYTANLYISLGREDAPATGCMFVIEADIEEIATEDYTAQTASYAADRRNGAPYDMFSFSAYDFASYDPTEASALKSTLFWSIEKEAESGEVKNGVFQPEYTDNNADNTNIPAQVKSAYRAKKDNGDSIFDNVFALKTIDSAATARMIIPFPFEADSYYMIDVSMAVIVEEANDASAYGAGLYLHDSNGIYGTSRFENIQTTWNEYGKKGGQIEFRTYQFYVATSDDVSYVYLCVSMGDTAYMNRYVSGSAYISYINIVDLGIADETLEENDLLRIIYNHVESEDTDEDTEDEDHDHDTEDEDHDHDHEHENESGLSDIEKWWLIPSILLGIAIVAAFIGVFIRKIMKNKARRQTTQNLNTYDRRYVTVVTGKDGTKTYTVDGKEIDASELSEAQIEEINEKASEEGEVTVELVEENVPTQEIATNDNEPSTEEDVEEFKDEFEDK